MSNYMIFGGYLENMQIRRSLRRHFSASQFQYTKLPPIKVSNPSLHNMPVLVKFSIFS